MNKGLINTALTVLAVMAIAFVVGAPALANTNTADHLVDEKSHPVYLPIIIYELDPIIPDSTFVLSQDSGTSPESISMDGTTFTFSENNPTIDQIAVGDVIASAPIDSAPEGFLRTVIDRKIENGDVILTTTQASLEEAIEQGAVNYIEDLTPDEVESVETLTGVTLQSGTSASSSEPTFVFPMSNLVLFDADNNFSTTSDQVILNGSLRIKPSVNFNFTIKNHSLQQLSFSVTIRKTSNLTLRSAINTPNFSSGKEIQIAKVKLKPITIPVGNLPLVFTPVLTIQVGIDGQASAGLEFGASETVIDEGGLAYSSGSWSIISGHQEQHSFIDPRFFAEANSKAYISLKPTLMLYGVVGPWAEMKGYAKAKVTALSSADPPFKLSLYLGLEIPTGVKLEIFSKKISDVSTLVFRAEVLIHEWPETTPTPTTPTVSTPISSTDSPCLCANHYQTIYNSYDTATATLSSTSTPCICQTNTPVLVTMTGTPPTATFVSTSTPLSMSLNLGTPTPGLSPTYFKSRTSTPSFQATVTPTP